ncbi:unnamed protein product [Urochloa decumbens]|uniref:WAT1-related protein n=1 Tax=Urochloa decumbens TaxID=240449 RepID=A0ABC9FSZ0_9POAL
MDAASKKAYIIAIMVQVILTGMSVITKAAFDAGMSTFVFVFYRQAAGSVLMLPLALILQRKNAWSMPFAWLLKLFLCALIGSSRQFHAGRHLLLGVATQDGDGEAYERLWHSQDHRCRALPRRRLCHSLLLRPNAFSPVNHHRAFATHASGSSHANASSKAIWIEGTFLMLLANAAWSLSIVWQAALLKELPNRMVVATALCVFSALQSFVVAVAVERDFSRWQLRLDISLLAIFYAGFVVAGVSYYLQAWCVEITGPVFFAVWTPLCFVLTIFCSSFFLGEIVHLGSVVGGILLVGGLYSVLWGKNKESQGATCSQMNTMDCCAQDEEENEKPNKYELEEATSSASAGEHV